MPTIGFAYVTIRVEVELPDNDKATSLADYDNDETFDIVIQQLADTLGLPNKDIIEQQMPSVELDEVQLIRECSHCGEEMYLTEEGMNPMIWICSNPNCDHYESSDGSHN